MEFTTLLLLLLCALACLFSLLAFLRSADHSKGLTGDDLEKVRQDLLTELRGTRQELSATLTQSAQATAQQIAQEQSAATALQDKHLKESMNALAQQQYQLQRTVSDQMQLMNKQMQGNAVQNEQKLENIRSTMETRITSLQADNNQKLSEMRQTVDEKLQKTLDEKLKQSFGLVNERLEAVYKGLGEMQSLAAGVGDLKKVLSNVKTRGILGEVQLGAILEELLSRAQYQENIATIPGSTERVEYAVRLPGDGDAPVWMPIDAKFPVDAYSALLDAYELADSAAVEAAAKTLEQRVRGFAKDIHTKYIKVPYTTEFGIMFLPIEGLYAEVVRRGIADRIQAEFRITVAGPTTMAALLNSLQMGFRSLAIQKRSSEVWGILGNVRSEFDTFGRALAQTQTRLHQASDELENLVGVRTRQIQRKLKNVTALPSAVPEEAMDAPAEISANSASSSPKNP